jgi:hypothetical protein
MTGLLWGLVVLPGCLGVGLLFLGLAVLALPLSAILFLLAQTHDPYGLALDAWEDRDELDRRLDQAALSPVPLLASFDGRHFRAPVLARMILTGQLGDGRVRRFTPGEVRSVVKRLVRQGLLGRRVDLVLAAQGDREVVEAAAALPAARGQARAPRSVTPEEHGRLLARALPLTRGQNLLLTAVLAAAGLCLWARALDRFNPDSPSIWALTMGLAVAGVLTLLQHLGRRGERYAFVGLQEKGGTLMSLALMAFLALAVSQPSWNLSFWVTALSALVITNLLVPELIARWRGAGLLYPTWLQLWGRRLLTAALATAGCVGLAYLAGLVL